MNDCLFCKIVEKEIPAKIVYEDERVVAFRDINPQAPTHILIIPRKHIPTTMDIGEVDKELVGQMHLIAAGLAREEGLEDRGFRLVLNCNKDAGQEVFHLHLHLLGGRRFSWPPG
ncbi:TPA: histidine triad nucleotide-binding protein [bacterium]|nr:histidine triad nucleotide-binding protein [bacterium]